MARRKGRLNCLQFLEDIHKHKHLLLHITLVSVANEIQINALVATLSVPLMKLSFFLGELFFIKFIKVFSAYL